VAHARRILVFAAALVSLALLSASPFAAAEITLPCPAFNTGNSWRFAMKGGIGPTTISTVVLARDGKKIRVGEKTTATIPPFPGMPGGESQIVNSSEIVYEEVASGIVRAGGTTNGIQTFSEPPEPICGKLPSQWTVTGKTILDKRTTLSQSGVTARSLGKEKITVPAGTFDATVVEIRHQNSPDGTSGTPGVGDSASIIHAVDNVGFVRIAIITTQPAPQAAAMDPGAEALMQEGIKKMQRGEDASGLMQQLQAMSSNPDPAGNRPVAAPPLRHEIVLELESFVIQPPKH
jgi:hypothetical protein